mgnify:CR=1 FL=1
MLDKIKNKLKSKQAKVLIGNFFSLSALQLVGMLLPLITLPYVLRVIGFEKYGLVALALSLVAYFNSIVDYSFRITATRDVAVFRDSPKKLNLIYSKVITIKAVFLLLSLITITIIVLAYPPFYKEKFIFFSAALSLVGYMLFPEWFFQGIEKMKYITIINIVVKIAFAFSVFIFIRDESDYKIYPLMTSLGLLFSGIAGQYILIKKYNIKYINLSAKRIKKNIKENTPIFINQFVPNLYNNTGGFLLGIIAEPALLGIYVAIRKIIDISVNLLNIVSRVFFPFLNKQKSAFLFYKKLMFSTSVLGVIVLLLSNQLIFWYLDIVNPLAIWVLLILSLSIIGNTAYDVFGLNYFIVRNQDKLVMKNTIVMSIIGFCITIPLIYYFNIIGAALSLLISRSLLGSGLFFKYYQLKIKES